MNDRVKSEIPFVGLHAHSVAGSLFDALGYPPDHMDFCYENGGDALATFFSTPVTLQSARSNSYEAISGCVK